jgi:dUTP pyrophosphatase
MKTKFKKVHPLAVAPVYATPGAACFDLTAADDGVPHKLDALARVYRTGLAFEIPAGHVMLVYSRSGHGFNQAIRLSNSVGVIDADYRGEVMVSLRLDASVGAVVNSPRAGERIAQAMIVPVDRVEFEESDELSETARGAGGFGSTGV